MTTFTGKESRQKNIGDEAVGGTKGAWMDPRDQGKRMVGKGRGGNPLGKVG